MDVVLSSESTAQADFERMDKIKKEIGLDALVGGSAGVPNYEIEKPMIVEHNEETKE